MIAVQAQLIDALLFYSIDFMEPSERREITQQERRINTQRVSYGKAHYVLALRKDTEDSTARRVKDAQVGVGGACDVGGSSAARRRRFCMLWIQTHSVFYR